MKSWQLAVCGLVLMVVAGCQANRSSVALLERENSELEAKIFELAGLVKDCRRENAGLRKRLGSVDGEAPAGQLEKDESERSDFPDRMESPAIEVPAAEIPAEEFGRRFLEPERLVPPEESPAFPNQEAPRWPSAAPQALPQGTGPANKSGSPEPVDPPEGSATTANEAVVVPRGDNTQVAAIKLDDRLTGGYNADARGGHEGIITVVELRDADGRPLAAAAPMSVVVLDPALSGDAARVARWDFTAEEVARRYRKTPLSEGVHLEMVWPGALPIHGELHVFVRYMSDDGRRLQVDRPIAINVPALQAQLPLLAPPRGPAAESTTELDDRAAKPDKPADEWQRRSTPAVRPPAREPVRTSLLPKDRSSGSAKTAAPSRQPSAPRRRVPVWSPDRF